MTGKSFLPFPGPFRDPLTHIIIEGAKYLWNKFINKKEETSDRISKQGAMQEGKETIDEVIEINKAFNNLLEDLKVDIQKTEDSAIDELSYFFEEFIDYMQENEEVFIKRGIRVNKIVNKFERVKRKLRGELNRKMHKYISLDNVECREILTMRAGEKKKDRMNSFIDTAFGKALQDLIYDIKEEMLDIVKDIEVGIEEGIELTEMHVNEKTTICQQLEESISKDIDKKQGIVEQALLKVYIAEQVKSIIDVEDK